MLRGGTVVNTSPELRDLKSNFAALKDVADRTRGRVLDAFDPSNTSIFTRVGLAPSRSPLPVWDVLVPVLLALVLVDIAIRRIAWDWQATKQFVGRGRDFARMFTTTRTVETTGSIDALRDVRSGKRAESPKPTDRPAAPDPTFKFEAKDKTQGNLTDLLGGATDKPTPKAGPTTGTPKGQQGDKPSAGGGMSGLLDAKRKAQEEIKRREEAEK